MDCRQKFVIHTCVVCKVYETFRILSNKNFVKYRGYPYSYGNG
jgi:hypothetical protein